MKHSITQDPDDLQTIRKQFKMKSWAQLTFRGKTQGSLAKKVWNWLLMIAQRLLGESMGKASMKVAMFSKQRIIAPPAGKFFLLFRP